MVVVVGGGGGGCFTTKQLGKCISGTNPDCGDLELFGRWGMGTGEGGGERGLLHTQAAGEVCILRTDPLR